MKSARFEYHAPSTLAEASALVSEHAMSGARILAGGQSLVPTMAYRLARPGHLIDINGIAGLDTVAQNGSYLEIGALVRHDRFANPVISTGLGAILAHIASHIAHRPIRARGTFCGSLAHSDPASEWCLTAATFDTEMIAESIRGVRSIPSTSYFRGIMSTALEDDEILTRVRIRVPDQNTSFGFYEFSRRQGDFALAACLVSFRLEGKQMRDVRLAIGGVEDYPRRILEVEKQLEGQTADEGWFARAGELATGYVTSSAVDADYRLELVKTVIQRAFQHAMSSSSKFSKIKQASQGGAG